MSKILTKAETDAILSEIEKDLDYMKMNGERHEGDLRKEKNSVSAEFRHLGRWEHDEDNEWDREEDFREDDDQMIWAKGEYEKYMNKFEEWAKSMPWYSKVKLDLMTSEKNWCEFLVTLK